MFILETIKYLIETDTLNDGLPARLAPPGRVAALIQRRLQRLSSTALNLARVAAVAGSAFTFDLAASVLERPPLELADAHGELEEAQILRGERFGHDLLFEAVSASIPAAVKGLLHARVARWLEAAKAHPAVIARQWLDSGGASQAVPWLIEAARQAERSALAREAADAYRQAGEILESLGDTDQAAALRSRVVALQTPG